MREDTVIGSIGESVLRNRMTCVTGKRILETEALAEEALVQHHIINVYRAGEGPRNIYVCEDCGYWHFTSKGDAHALFADERVTKRIEQERIANQWERKLK